MEKKKGGGDYWERSLVTILYKLLGEMFFLPKNHEQGSMRTKNVLEAPLFDRMI